MKKVCFAFLFLLISIETFAQTYSLSGNSNWSGGVWSNASTAWSSDANTTYPPNNGSGDIIVKSGAVMTVSNTFNWNGTIKVETGGAVIFNREQPNEGSITMDAESVFILEKDAIIDSQGPAGHNKNYLTIGSETIYGNDIDQIDTSLGPVQLTEATLNSGGEPLPINLLYFTATAQTQSVEINWAASKAWDFSHYELQRSHNGKDFEWVATIDAEENTDHTTEFSYTDRQPHSGASYYRLKAVDIDGKYEYKGMEVVQFIGKNFEVYPNPVTNGNFKVNALQATEGVQLTLRDQTGRIVRSHSMSGQEESISTQGLPAGLYILLIQTSQQTTQSQLLIQ